MLTSITAISVYLVVDKENRLLLLLILITLKAVENTIKKNHAHLLYIRTLAELIMLTVLIKKSF